MDAPAVNSKPPTKPRFFTRLKRELRRLLILGLIVAALLVAAKFYGFNRLDEEIRARCETQLRASYPGLVVHVQSARRVEGKGVEIRGIEIREAGGRDAPILLQVDEIFAECDTHLPDFITRQPTIRSLQVRRMKLRAQRKPNGFWSLSHLLPLPTMNSGSLPTATISDGSIEVIDDEENHSWTLRNINLTVRPETAAVLGANPTAAAPVTLKIQGTAAGDYLERVELAGELDPRGGRWDIRGAVEGLEFSPRLRSALPLELSEMLEPLASIRGRTFFGFQTMRGAADPLSKSTPPVQFIINGKIAEGRIDDARLTDPLTEVEATIYADNRGIRIDDLSARCGTALLELHGEIDGYSTSSPCRLDLHARRLDLSRLPLDSLSPSVRDVMELYSPRGMIDLDAKLQFDGCIWQPELSIACHDVSLLYRDFKYRVTDGTGVIELKQDLLTARLRTIGGGTNIDIRAEIRHPGPNFTGWIDLASHGPVPIDEKLIAALDSKGQKVVRLFQPRGGMAFHAWFQRDANDPVLHRTVTLDLSDCSIAYEHFRYPIDKISGSLQLTDDDWVFKRLEGRNDSGFIVGEGNWLADARDGNQLSLTFTATDVPLGDELRRALSPALQQLWKNLRPRGNIDHLKVQIKYNPNIGDLGLEIEAIKWPPAQNVEGRSISIEPAWFRYKLDNLTGRMLYRDGEVTLTNLQAVHGQTTVATDGSCSLQPDGSSRVQLSRLTAGRINLNNELLTALPESLSSALAGLNVSGPIGMNGGLGFVIPAESDRPPTADWDLAFDLENGRLDGGVPIEHIHGGIRLWGKSDQNGFHTRGELKVDSAIVRDVQLTQIHGPIWIDPERLLVGTWAQKDVRDQIPRQMTANVFSGVVSLDAHMALTGDGRFQLQSTLENADLANIAAELAPQQQGLSGKVNSLVTLSGTMQGKYTWRGDGQIRLFDANIYELPVMISMLKLLSVRDPNRTAFTTSNIDFRIEGDDLEFKRIDFNGDAVSLKGVGRMNAAREIDLKFYPQLVRDEALIPVFRPLNAEAGRQFLLVEVVGTLDQPQVTKQAFPRIDARLQQIFPELATEEVVPEPLLPILRGPREALQRSGMFPWKR